MEDNQIIDLYIARDERAIQETDAKYGQYCGSLVRRILDNQQDTEEIVNDTWMHTWCAIPPERPGILRLFLARISRNLAFSRYRGMMAQKRGGTQVALCLEELSECIPGENDPCQELEEKELVLAIKAYLTLLPERDRNIFIRRYFFLDSVGEIADRFFLKESNVHMILSRVRRKLNAHLIKEGYV